MAIEEDPDPGIPEWVVTFGDMMSLLLTFFIMLISLSEIKEEERFQAMVESFRKQFGHDASTVSVISGENKPRNSRLAKLATMGRAKRFNIMKGGDKVNAPVGDYPRVKIVRPGSRTTVGTVIYFPEHSPELNERAQEDLQNILPNLAGLPQKIEVRGHTSRRPIGEDSRYRDNSDLTYERCRAVGKFIETLGIDPRRIRMAVAGPYEPLHLGADPVKLKQNPRVDVWLLDELVTDFAGTREGRERRYTNEGGVSQENKPSPQKGETKKPDDVDPESPVSEPEK